jgi:hypothetical protein
MKISQWIEEKIDNMHLIGFPSTHYEDATIKAMDPKFYKERVSKRKKRFDKKGLPIEPYVWMQRMDY